MDKKINNTTLKYLLTQIILFSFLIFLIISVSFNFDFINKINNLAFKFCDLIRSNFINNFMLIITYLGEALTLVIILIFILIFNKKLAFPLISLTALSTIINYSLKNILQISRPTGEFVSNLIFNYPFPSSYSFPSGHSQTSLVFYFLLGFLFLKNYYKGKHTKLYLFLISILPLSIGFSRIMLGVHYFTDVLSGFVIGLIILTNFIYFSYKINEN